MLEGHIGSGRETPFPILCRQANARHYTVGMVAQHVKHTDGIVLVTGLAQHAWRIHSCRGLVIPDDDNCVGGDYGGGISVTVTTSDWDEVRAGTPGLIIS